MIARDLHDVRAVKFALLRSKVADDLECELGSEVSGYEGCFEVIPVDVGFGETLEEGLEKTGHEKGELLTINNDDAGGRRAGGTVETEADSL